jgi:hypothetical protein
MGKGRTALSALAKLSFTVAIGFGAAGCAAESDTGTFTTRYDGVVAQTAYTETGDLHTVLVDANTKTQLATMDWQSDTSRLSWNVSDRARGAQPMTPGPHVGDMNRAVFRLYQDAWADPAAQVKPTF